MHAFLAVLGRELRAYFVSPMAWIVLTFFLLVQGYTFSTIVSHLSDPASLAGATPFDYFFGNFVYWFLLLFLAPVITMRLIAEERRSGTVEALMTAPISEGQVVTAKFLAALGFYSFLWAPTALYPLLTSRSTEIDWGPIAAGYIGTLGIGAMALAIGLFGSSFTKNQIVAAMASFGLLLLFFILPWLQDLVIDPGLADALAYTSLPDHMGEFGKGIVDTRRLVYYASTAGLFLFLTTRALEAKKWR